MIPLPPLDGGRVAVGLLPDALAFPLARSERYGMLDPVALCSSCRCSASASVWISNIMAYIMQPPVDWITAHASLA